MPYTRKTSDEWRVLGDYGHGFEEVTAATSWKAARGHLREYRDNEPGIAFKVTGPHRVPVDVILAPMRDSENPSPPGA